MIRATIALWILLLAIPVASADHVYSHRYVIFGRVVDADGHAVPNVTVTVATSDSFRIEGGCNNQPHTETDAFGPTRTRPLTNELGEFSFCYHTHLVARDDPPRAVLRVEGVAGAEINAVFDGELRAQFVVLRVPRAMAESNVTALDHVATLGGRIWKPQPGAVLEGVPVYGLTVNLVPVNITFEHDGVVDHVQTRTNNYGDFAVRDNLSIPLKNGTLTVECEGITFTAPYHPDLGIAWVRGNESAPGAADGIVPPPPLPTPRAAPGFAVLGALAALALAAFARQMR